MIVEFKSSSGRIREIFSTDEELSSLERRQKAFEIIHEFCAERNFKIYYSRLWNTPDGKTCVDVGSHTEFFYISPEVDIRV